MLFLLFQIGENRYALDTAAVVEIVPQVALKRLPSLPTGVAGVLDYHGAPVPVLDLSALTEGTPAGRRFSTRLILVRADHGPRPAVLVGLLAERATGTLRREPADFVDPGLSVPGAGYLGQITRDEEGFVQCVRLENLLAGPVSALLHPAPTTEATP